MLAGWLTRKKALQLNLVIGSIQDSISYPFMVIDCSQSHYEEFPSADRAASSCFSMTLFMLGVNLVKTVVFNSLGN